MVRTKPTRVAPKPGRWLVLVRPDGVVDAAEDGAPSTWVGRQLQDVPGLDAALYDAADDVVFGDRTPPVTEAGSLRRREVAASPDGKRPAVELIVVDAIPVRRAFAHVGELVLEAIDVLAPQARACGVALTVEIEPGAPRHALLDGPKIAWVLATLVGNALRFVTRREPSRGVIVVHVSGGDGTLVFEVRDNGPGMPEKTARWLFDRDPSTGKSAGLALVMVKDVALAHRGTVAVESSPGHGTKFVLRLPQSMSRSQI